MLKVKPLNEFGSPMEIIKEFGGKKKYMEALYRLEYLLYNIAN